MVDLFFVHVSGGDNSLDNFFHKFSPHLIEVDVLRVLYRDYDGVHADGDTGAVVHAVLTGHLCF